MSGFHHFPRFVHPNGFDSRGSRFPGQRNNNRQKHQQGDSRPSVPTTATTTKISNDNNAVANQTGTEPQTNSQNLPAETSNETTSTSTENVSQAVQSAPTKLETSVPRENSAKRSFESESSASQKPVQGGRSRLFIGNIPSDLTQEQFQSMFSKYGQVIESYVNAARGFAFIKLASKQQAEEAKHELDGFVLRGKALRVRFASQGAIVKVKNLSPNVSNELLKEAFQHYFGAVERAVVIVDDRGKSIGEGIVEFEKKPSAQKCLNECTEGCFFLTGTLKPIIVEPWDTKDEEDGLPEKMLIKNEAYYKERQLKPRFAELDTFELTIGLKWKELELQEKQLLDEVKRRMQHASEQLQIEIDGMLLEHEAQQLREELNRRQEDLRRIDERRSQDLDRRRQWMTSHHPDPYHGPIGNMFPDNGFVPNTFAYHEASQMPVYDNMNPFTSAPPVDAAYTTNQVARGYDFNQQTQGFQRKRARF